MTCGTIKCLYLDSEYFHHFTMLSDLDDSSGSDHKRQVHRLELHRRKPGGQDSNCIGTYKHLLLFVV